MSKPAASGTGFHVEVMVSAIEIYNEAVQDTEIGFACCAKRAVTQAKSRQRVGVYRKLSSACTGLCRFRQIPGPGLQNCSWPSRFSEDLLIPVESRPRKGFEIRESKILGAHTFMFDLPPVREVEGVGQDLQ